MITEEEKEAILKLNTLYTNKEMSVKYAKIDNRMTAFKQQLDKEVNSWKIILNLIEKQTQLIDLMAEDLKTDYHSKEWVIKNYEEKVK